MIAPSFFLCLSFSLFGSVKSRSQFPLKVGHLSPTKLKLFYEKAQNPFLMSVCLSFCGQRGPRSGRETKAKFGHTNYFSYVLNSDPNPRLDPRSFSRFIKNVKKRLNLPKRQRNQSPLDCFVSGFYMTAVQREHVVRL